MKAVIQDAVQQILPSIVELRHTLHRRPEIALQEYETADCIGDFLQSFNIPHRRGLAGGTGILVDIPGKTTDKWLALRADIDALPIEEQLGIPYRSTNTGVMHACGHDGHAAILCGVAVILWRLRNKLPCSVRLIFQPGEEGVGAAYEMVSEGVMEHMDAIFALHGWPDVPLGTVAVRSGCMMAGMASFTVTIRGGECHGAKPHEGRDPVLAGAHIMIAIQTMLTREIDPLTAAVATIGTFHAGESANVIPGKAVLSGTLRYLDDEAGEHLKKGLVRIARNTARAFDVEAAVVFDERPYPTLYNDASMTEKVIHTAEKILGPDAVISLDKPVMVSEDFSWYLREVPGALFYLGLRQKNKDIVPLHTSCFDFPDAALPYGMKMMSYLAFEFS